MTKSGPEDILPLSPLQEGLLFHALYDETGSDVYTVQVVLDLGGRLDEDVLRATAEALLRRHANLRVGFLHPKQSRPVQVVAREVELPGSRPTCAPWTRDSARPSWTASRPRRRRTASTCRAPADALPAGAARRRRVPPAVHLPPHPARRLVDLGAAR